MNPLASIQRSTLRASHPRILRRPQGVRLCPFSTTLYKAEPKNDEPKADEALKGLDTSASGVSTPKSEDTKATHTSSLHKLPGTLEPASYPSSRRSQRPNEKVLINEALTFEQICQTLKYQGKKEPPTANIAAIPESQWIQVRYALLSILNVPVPAKKTDEDSSSVFGSGDSLFLSCAYPGSGKFLENSVSHLVHATDSSLLSFDLHDLISLEFIKRAFPTDLDSTLPVYPINPNPKGPRSHSIGSLFESERREEEEEEDDEEEHSNHNSRPAIVYGSVPNFLKLFPGNGAPTPLANEEQLICRRLRRGFVQLFKEVATNSRTEGGNLIIHFNDVLKSLHHPSAFLVVRSIYQAIQDLKQTLDRNIVLVCTASPPLANSSLLHNGDLPGLSRFFMGDIESSTWARHFVLTNFHPYLISSQSVLPTNLEPKGAEAISADSWFKQLVSDWKQRVLEVNLKNILNLCQSRGVDFKIASLPFVEEAGQLSATAWPKSHLIRLVSSTIGYVNDCKRDTSSIVVTVQDILHCLKFVPKPDFDPLFSSASATSGKPNPDGTSASLPVIHSFMPPTPSLAAFSPPDTPLNSQLDSIRGSCDSYERKLFSCVVNPATLTVGFDDIRILPSTVATLQNLITLPLLRPTWFSTGVLARHFISGVLLFGPPGTGKTLLAKAVAKESGSSVLEIKGSDVFNKYVGEGEKTVQAIFRLARRLSPCVIFVDEVDALFGSRRNDSSNAGRREIINQFMMEWDGLTSANKGVIVMAATNRPFDLDDAILRRLPRRILVDLPNATDREHILKLHLTGENLDEDVQTSWLASKTEGYSGSDLKNLCVATALASLQDLVHKELGGPLNSSVNNLRKLLEASPKNQTKGSEGTKPNPEGSETSSGIDRTLQKKHFETALTQVNASISDEMGSVLELRKWDKQYGDGAPSRIKRVQFGFGALKPSDNSKPSESPAAST